ncbi:MAG: hemerythrin domain-containing protein, partial [Pseudomonadota bacterium]
MFAFIKDFFKGRPKEIKQENVSETTARVEMAKNNRRRTIMYDPALIDTLKADHSELVMIYGRM